MTQCTAPQRGHRTPGGRAKCPVCGSNPYSSYQSSRTQPANLRKLDPIPSVHKNKQIPPKQNVQRPLEGSNTSKTIQWLIEHPTHVEQIEWIANQIGETAEALLKEYGLKYQRLADHLWCDILAAVAEALEKTLNVADELIDITAESFADQVCNLVLSGRNHKETNLPSGNQTLLEKIIGVMTPRRKSLDEVIVRQATKMLVKKTFQRIFLEPRAAVEAFLLQIRLLALSLCPAPEKHRTVWNSCAVPLIRAQIVSESLAEIENMKQMMEQQGKTFLN